MKSKPITALPPTDARSDPALLRVRSLTLTRGERVLCRQLEFALDAGQILTISGRNGSGKTTLLRACAGLVLPARGTVLFEGCDALRLDSEQRRRMAYLGHADGLHPDLLAHEELRFAGLPRATIDTRLEAFGLSAARDLPTRALSSGQRRRLALARTFASAAALWILDEPINALDRDGVAAVSRLLGEHAAGGGAALLTTHQPLPELGGQTLDLG